MDVSRPELLSASDAARAVAAGALSAEQLVQACLARIREVEPAVQAWQYLDEAHALAQARSRDLDRAEGRPLGPLHGVPVGIKDIIDTTDMPTEDGTVLHAGRRPARDAAVVAQLRAAGAVILGKTVTTECATYPPSKTRNPHDATRSPGGSSAGSAAAVAAGMVPLAIGTQTNASTIRPASFCGVYGFKPTHGLISRHGVLKLSRSLDCVGLFARSLDDIALAVEQLTGFDENDPDTRPRARIPFVQTLAGEPPLAPRVAFVKTPDVGARRRIHARSLRRTGGGARRVMRGIPAARDGGRGVGLAPHHHGGRDGGPSRPRVREGSRQVERVAAQPAGARPRDHRVGISARAEQGAAVDRRLRRAVRQLRRHRHARRVAAPRRRWTTRATRRSARCGR